MGVEVLQEFARRLELAEPALPWHTERSRMGEIAGALAVTAGVLDSIALDISLLAQTEVGEVAEMGDGHQGGSSTMPHKENPVRVVMVRACVREAQAQADVLFRCMAQEYERAAGAWQAEWPALSGALVWTGGAAWWLDQSLDGLRICPERMRANLEVTRGLIMAERAAGVLTEHLGRQKTHELLRSLSLRARDEGRTLGELLLANEAVRAQVGQDEIERAMDPASYLGSAGAFIDRALALHEASS
jgi:3-carboxy-cis,cis-muconate cycloisomerase